MRDALEDLTARAATLTAIGTGDVAYAQAFAEEQGITFPLLVDDASVSYRAVGTRKGRMTAIANPRLLAAGARATAEGHRQGAPGRAPLVLGATHVILGLPPALGAAGVDAVAREVALPFREAIGG